MGTAPQPPLRFDEFELDEANARLTRSGSAVQLPPKAFAVLCALTGQAGRLITKGDLLDTVWGHQHVSESVLKTTISQLRAALADDASQPRYIETSSRRGYRFIGTIDPSQAAPALPLRKQPDSGAPGTMIGRRAALDRMHAAWQGACAGHKQVIWIAGEPGVGKTTLIERFVDEIGTVARGHGQCVEQYGAGEPYLPVLEALTSLCRKYPELPAMMRTIAPTWLLQLPWFCSDSDRATLRQELAGATQDRMMREIAELIERFSAERPLLFITEDLHWSDQSTLQLMDRFARRRGRTQVMWLASFRLTQIMAESHPLVDLRHELRLHRLCDEIILDPFSETEVDEYLRSRMPDVDFPEDFIHRLHTHTDGLPLFVANVLENLATQEAGREWLQRKEWAVPDSLAGGIERQIARLPEETQALLEAASVCGVEFRPSTVGEVIGRDAQWVSERCDELVRRKHWLRHVDTVDLPDGSLDTRYAFRHALYRHVFYQRIAPSARVQLHRRVALSMERGRTQGFAVTAAELATQYEAGMVHASALRHYAAAAENALKHFSPLQAIELTGHALELLPKCRDGNEKLELEFALVAHRGVACSQRLGLGAPEAEAAYRRAQVLCEALPPSPMRLQVLAGLGWMYYIRGQYEEARKVGEQIHELAVSLNDPVILMTACGMLGVVLTVRAEHAGAREYLERSIAACELLGDRVPIQAFVADPLVVTRANVAVPLMHLGLVDQARQQMHLAIARAQARGHLMARSIALWMGAMFEMRMKRPELVAQYAQQLAELVAANTLVQAEGPSRWMRGWAAAYLGSPEEGLKLIREGYEFNRRLGMVANGSEVLGYAVEAHILMQDWEGAARQLEEARGLAQGLGERILFPYQSLLEGRIAAGTGKQDQARAAMLAGAAESRKQGSIWMELRMLTSACELPNATAEDLSSMRAVYLRMQEGRDVWLCVQARQLLEKHGLS